MEKDRIIEKLFHGKDAWQVMRVISDITNGYDKLRYIENGITVFGSARLTPETKYYKKIEALTKKLSDKGYDIITGGGPGIMEAANSGAYKNNEKTKSVGIGIELPFESGNNEFIDYNYNLSLRYFFIRKLMLINFSKAYIAAQGGFGTLEELFEVITLIQTGKIDKRPVILYGKKFWGDMYKWLYDMCLKEFKTVSDKDFEYIYLVDTDEEVFEILENYKSE